MFHGTGWNMIVSTNSNLIILPLSLLQMNVVERIRGNQLFIILMLTNHSESVDGLTKIFKTINKSPM